MNTGAEAVETAIKAVRRWGYDVKGIAENQAEIIACVGNFHGRTMALVSLSSDEEYRRGFGPMLPGIKLIPYGDLDALKEAITPQTAGFLIEPIQGEAGIIIPPQGFLKEAYDLCKENNVLFVSDEIQSGLGRSGKMFASDWDGVVPDMYILGKALGGGVFPISCVVRTVKSLAYSILVPMVLHSAAIHWHVRFPSLHWKSLKKRSLRNVHWSLDNTLWIV